MEVNLPGGRMSAEVRGDGTPVLILHGGGLDHRHMLDALEPVFESTSGWKRIYLDLPGHGQSLVDETISSQDDVLQMIRDFIDVALDGEKCAVIGESRGSYHAMGLVHLRPDDFLGMMLVVADGMPDATVDWRPEHKILVKAADEIVHAASLEAQKRFSRLVVQDPVILEKIERTKVPAVALADQRLAESLRKNFCFSFDLMSPSKPFDAPCLIVNGRQDAIAGYQDMINVIERYPRATLAVLDCAGHSLAWERPTIFAALTLDWLERIRR